MVTGSLPANASGFDPHRASVTGRLGQVFDEIKAVRQMRFRFQQDQAAADYAQGLCVDMGVYDHPNESVIMVSRPGLWID